MNTARQATENMEYVRRLLEEKQAGFAPSVELAVSVIRQQHVQQRRIGAGQQRLPG
jgi:ABC-type transport system involved in cytochrome c biogenesis ATPase subunit